MAIAHHHVLLLASNGDSVSCRCDGETALADALERAGIGTRLACRGGGCGACVAGLESGEIRYLSPISVAKLASCSVAGGQPLFLCRAAPASDLVIRLPGHWARRQATPLSKILECNRTQGPVQSLPKT